jgi:hypothetical protein
MMILRVNEGARFYPREEFQIIDPETRDLLSHIQQILDDGKMTLKEHVKPEMHQSMVELGTEICSGVQHARRQVVELRTELAALAARGGLKIASAGTHPFAHWRDQLITGDEHYATIVQDMQQIARANLIFGLHVHVGIPDRQEGIEPHESGAVFSAASVRALGEFAVLAGGEHGAESLPADDLPALSAHGHSGRVRESLGVRRLPEAAGGDGVHR